MERNVLEDRLQKLPSAILPSQSVALAFEYAISFASWVLVMLLATIGYDGLVPLTSVIGSRLIKTTKYCSSF